jgi:hypothetical protein
MVAAGTLIALPALLSLAFTIAFGVNVVFVDEFTFIPYIAALQTKTLTLQALFEPYNEHRLLFPRLVQLATASVTHFNTKAEMFLYWLCLCGICALFLLIFTKANGFSFSSLLLFAPASYLIFSLRQFENFLFGWEICWGLAALFSILAIYLLQLRRSDVLSLALAMASGVIASFSILAGLLIWPAGLVEMAYLSRNPRRRRFLWVAVSDWLLAGIAVFAVYFHRLERPSYLPGPSSILQAPLHSLRFFLAALGAPLAVEPNDAAAIGILLGCFAVFVFVHQWRRPYSRSAAVWVAVLAFGLASEVILAAGRSSFGIDLAVGSRYTTFGLLGLAALYLWCVTQLDWKRMPETLAGSALLTLLAVGTVAGYSDALYQGRSLMLDRKDLARYELNFDRYTDAELAPHFVATPVLSIAQQLVYLRNEGLSVFYGTPPTQTAYPAGLPSAGLALLFGIDNANGVALAPNGATIVAGPATENVVLINGWAADTVSRLPAGGVFVDVDGQTQVPASYGLDRPDIATYLNDSSYERTGFRAGFSSDGLAKGKHVLTFRILAADSSSFYQPDYRLTLDVR